MTTLLEALDAQLPLTVPVTTWGDGWAEALLEIIDGLYEDATYAAA